MYVNLRYATAPPVWNSGVLKPDLEHTAIIHELINFCLEA